jgi:hypothetical protein
MKLDCAVVKDMYVLYNEGELSKAVKSAVEEHLKECPECGRVYECGEGFQDILGEAEKLLPSKKTDEKVMLSLKVKRLKIAVMFVLAVFMITSFQSYYSSRKHLLSDISSAEHALWQIKLGMENVNTEAYAHYSAADTLHFINDRSNIINRNLNFLEKRALNGSAQLFIHPRLVNLMDMLNIRYTSGSWSQTDEEVLVRLNENTLNAVKLLAIEKVALINLQSNRLLLFTHKANVRELSEIYADINLLTLTYYNYNRLPEEMTLAGEEDLKEKLTSLFGTGEVKLHPQREYTKTSGIVDFELKTEDEQRYHGTLDAYTGDIISVFTLTAEYKGELLPREAVEENLTTFLKTLHQDNFNYNIEYSGINHNFTSNVDHQLYTYTVTPVFNGFRVDYPMQIRMNARTGRLYSLDTHKGTVPAFDAVDTDILIPQAEALIGLKLPQSIPIPVYRETVLIKSFLSGKIQPIHVYSQNHIKYYINAVTGKREYHQ